MKKIIFISLSVLIFSFSTNNSFAQQHTQTAYEKKVNEIENRYTQKIIQIKLRGGGPSDFRLLKYRMEKELKRAERLKTKVDFQREKKKKLEEARRKAQEKFEQSDYGQILKEVKSSFEKWNKKGEFEKKEDWLNRLENETQNAFDKICIEEIRKLANNRIILNNNSWSCELSDYNTEKEIFHISLSAWKLKWDTILKIPISEAKKFKDSFSWYIEDYYDVGILQNALFPSYFTIHTSSKEYKIQTIQKGVPELIVSFDKLNIKNKFLKGYEFNYSDAIKKMKIEEERRAEEKEEKRISYNNRLDSLFNTYNDKLLNNPYNIDKDKIRKGRFSKITNQAKQKKAFNDNVNLLMEEYNYALDRIKRKFANAYSKNSRFFSNEEEFGVFYKKGTIVFNDEIKKRKIFTFLKRKRTCGFIALMNFKKNESEINTSIYVGDIENGISCLTYIGGSKARQYILSLLQKNKGKSYYPQILSYVIQKNKRMSKEWDRKGKYFQNQEEFYDAYISVNYKNILRNKKRK